MKALTFLAIISILFSCNSNPENKSSETDTLNSPIQSGPVDALDTAGGKGVFFAELKDGQEVKSPFIVKMKVEGMEVEKAGPINGLKGHHHIVVDGTAVPETEPIILDDTHLHYGLGQTEAELKLAPGAHTLTLQFGNGVHASYGPRWSRTISVMVK